VLATVVVFMLMHLAPGDPTETMLGPGYSPARATALREKLGLDQPLPIQYLTWLRNVATGDLGTSIRNKQAVSTMIQERLPATATLAVLALLFALAIALPIGVVSATRRNSWLDYVSMSFSIFGVSTPNFVLAILLILLLSVNLGLLPISGYENFWTDPGQASLLLIMPVIALGVSNTAVLARMMRASMLEVLNKDYVRVARAKGLKDGSLLLRHALKNALIPVITIAAIRIGDLLGGSVVIEQVFGIPGLGTLVISAVLARDFPVIQGVTLVIAGLFLLASLVADFMYALVDPRIRLQ
jgi:peptide/nickel transport system permease protein